MRPSDAAPDHSTLIGGRAEATAKRAEIGERGRERERERERDDCYSLLFPSLVCKI